MSSPRSIRLVRTAAVRRAALDTAVSRALLQEVSDGVEPETLRLYRPGRVVALGPQDLRAAGYRRAVEASLVRGFEPVIRLAGGRAAVFHEDTIAFSWTIPDQGPREQIHQRFRELARLMESAFKRLGVDARVGAVPGEYCPGEYSVNARGVKKLMGVGQRVVRRAAHLGGVVVVDGAFLVRDILVPVYEAMEFAWEPDTTGSLAGEAPGITYEDAQRVLIEAFAENYDLYEGAFSTETLALARSFEPDHRVDLATSSRGSQ